MTDEIGISITAANSGTEPGRIERLLDVVAIAHSLLDRNVIDMADEDTEEGTYTAFVKALVSIRDDNGSLIVILEKKALTKMEGCLQDCVGSELRT